jgi:hypothetical protein
MSHSQQTSLAVSVVVCLAPVPALAQQDRQANSAQWIAETQFTLAKARTRTDGSVVPVNERSDASTAHAVTRHEFRDEGLEGPSWTYQAREDGPVLEVAGLGAGKKGRPKLVHFALDWNF